MRSTYLGSLAIACVTRMMHAEVDFPEATTTTTITTTNDVVEK